MMPAMRTGASFRKYQMSKTNLLLALLMLPFLNVHDFLSHYKSIPSDYRS